MFKVKTHSILAGLAFSLLLVSPAAQSGAKQEPKTVYGFKAESIEGKTIFLSQFKGKALLIVNVASKCGYTPQYEGLEALYKKYKDKGLIVLGFPCNQFGSQEPGNAKEIADFCKTNYGVTFPLFSKIEVNGAGAHPLYEFLKKGASIQWNFTKFLIGKDGRLVQRHESKVKPEEIEKDIEKALAQGTRPTAFRPKFRPKISDKNTSAVKEE